MPIPDTGPQYRWLAFQRAAVNVEERTVELSFSSEIRLERWYGVEILSHDPESVDLERLNQIGVLLFNHDGDEVIGRVEKAWVDAAERRGKAMVRFDEDEPSERIFQKVVNGTLRGCSVWYNVSNWEEVAAGAKSVNGRFEGPCYVALKWQPYEVSIVSVPADPTVGVGRGVETPAIKAMLRKLVQEAVDEHLARGQQAGQEPDLSDFYRRLSQH